MLRGREERAECERVLMGCTGPLDPGWEQTWPAVDRVVESKVGASDDNVDKGRERRMWRTRGTSSQPAPTAGWSEPRLVSVFSTGRGPGQLAGRSGKKLVLRSCQRGVGELHAILGLRCKEELSPPREQCEAISRGWHSTQMGCGLSLRSGQPGEWRGLLVCATVDSMSISLDRCAPCLRRPPNSNISTASIHLQRRR